MSTMIQLTRAAFVDLLNSLTAAPDDDGRVPAADVRPAGTPADHGRGYRPHRPPHWAKMVVQAFADRIHAADQAGQPVAAGQAAIAGFVDDFCGTEPKWPVPWRPVPGPVPWWPDQLQATGELTGADLLVAGSQFQTTAELADGEPLQAAFSAAADRLFDAGLKRLGQAKFSPWSGHPAVDQAKHESFAPAEAKHESFAPAEAKHESFAPAEAKQESIPVDQAKHEFTVIVQIHQTPLHSPAALGKEQGHD